MAQLMHDIGAVDEESGGVFVGRAQDRCHCLLYFGVNFGLLHGLPRSEEHTSDSSHQ